MIDKIITQPIVSIIIVTYNSSKYILETLNSARSQTYQNIELIVSDDCSTDDTVKICKDWLEINKSRFVRGKLVIAENNAGVAANCNRGVNNSVGEWIKLIAGDDLLVPNAIFEFMEFVKISNTQICCSKLSLFGEDVSLVDKAKKMYENLYISLKKSQRNQLRLSRKSLFIPGPGIFFSKELFRQVNGFDERFPFCEEWPFFLNVLEKGHHIKFLNNNLILYRVNNGSLCRDNNRYSKIVFESVKDYFFSVRIYKMLKHGMFFSVWYQLVSFLYDSQLYKNVDVYSFKMRFLKLLILLNPLVGLSKIKRILIKI